MGWTQDRSDPGQDYMRGGPDEGANELRKSMTTWRQKMPFKRRSGLRKMMIKESEHLRRGELRSGVCVCILNLIAFVIR